MEKIRDLQFMSLPCPDVSAKAIPAKKPSKILRKRLHFTSAYEDDQIATEYGEVMSWLFDFNTGVALRENNSALQRDGWVVVGKAEVIYVCKKNGDTTLKLIVPAPKPVLRTSLIVIY
jgi:hypothetical protein